MSLGEEAWKEEGLLERGAFLRPDALNDSNHLQIFVYCNDAARTCVVAARLDNLGKGASGAAVQNLNRVLLSLNPEEHLSATININFYTSSIALLGALGLDERTILE